MTTSLTPEQRTARARLAARSRHNPDADLSSERRELRAASLEAHVRRVVDQLPPLTDAQRDRIATLLRPQRSVANG
ncbi:hypothetical protein ACQPX6_10290 [Actinomycetospora sp. CA-101289]|uniref:hypothetical protein n=1 Tax=Actinomycetospora sp. CA-101289 TaxID=3239893 RepID=UPI003D988D4C